MKKIAFFLTIAILTGCSNPKTPDAKNSTAATIDSSAIRFKTELNDLSDLKKKYEKASQMFTISSDKPTIVKGNKGTTIYINPADLTTLNGKAPGKTIDIELKELLSANDLLNSNAQTISDGRLLISGGAYFINMTSIGEQLKLKDGTSLKVELPKIDKSNMTLFYGQKDSLGQMNWTPSETAFVSKQEKPKPAPQIPETKGKSKDGMDELINFLTSGNSTTMTAKEREDYEQEVQLHKKVYDAVYLTSLGWINCDRFMGIQNKTDLLVHIDPSLNISSASLFLVFKDINSVIQSYYNNQIPDLNGGFQNIPVGKKVRLVAFAIKDKQIFTYSEEITIKAKDKLIIKLNPTSEGELKKLMAGA